MGSIEARDFGTTQGGEHFSLYLLENDRGMSAGITDLGGCIVSLGVPDKNGATIDVELGYDDAAGYAVNKPNLGAPIGRYANRIGGASFVLDGQRYELERNDHEVNNLHSGSARWRLRRWDVLEAERDERGSHIRLHLSSPDGDQGFPGACETTLAYELTNDGALAITYEVLPSACTVVNMTNHSYFNLNGYASGTVAGHVAQIDAKAVTAVDENLIPTGKLVAVDGTPFDLREPKALGLGLASGDPAIEAAGGYDHNYALRPGTPQPSDEGFVGALRHVARVRGDKTGIVMDVATDLPGMQLYTGNHVGGERGKGGSVTIDHGAFCLETQFFPDAVNHPEFAQPVFGPEKPYRSRTIYSFSTEK